MKKEQDPEERKRLRHEAILFIGDLVTFYVTNTILMYNEYYLY